MPAITRAQTHTPPAEQPRGAFARREAATPPVEQPRGAFAHRQCATPFIRPRGTGAFPTNDVLFKPFNPGLQ